MSKSLNDMKELILKTKTMVFDTETTGKDLKDTIIGISIGTEGVATFEYVYDDIAKLESFKDLLLNEDILKIGHNIKFDIQMLKKHGIEVKGQLFDTMLAYWFTNPEYTKAGLKNIAKKEFGIDTPTYKQTLLNHKYKVDVEGSKKKRIVVPKNLLDIPRKKLEEYCNDDVRLTWRVFELTRHLLDNKCFMNIDMKLLPVLMEIELNGIHLDIDRLTALENEATGLLEALETNLRAIVGNDININSGAQLIDLLFNKLGFQPISKTDTGLASTDDKTLEALSASGHPFANVPQMILEYRKVQKVYGTYILSLKRYRQSDGRVYPTYNQHKTSTGRLSCIAEGTMITCLNGEKPIESITTDDYVYCMDKEHKVQLKKVLKTINQGRKECIKLKWFSASGRFGTLTLTPDHLVKSVDRGWIKAEQLADFEEVYHISRIKQATGRIRTYSTGRHMELEEQVVKRSIFGSTDADSVIHHLNFIKDDNRKENLLVMPRNRHGQLHGFKSKYEGQKLPVKDNRGSMVYLSGSKNWSYIHKTKFELLRMFSKSKGKLSKAGMDYSTFLKKLDNASIDYRTLKDRYTKKGLYVSKGKLESMLIKESKTRVSKRLGVGLKGITKLLKVYNIPINHRIVGIEKDTVRNVFDLEIEGEHCFIASELLVHNCDSPNVQNQPKQGVWGPKIRGLFRAEQGNKLIRLDFSQMELRMGAHIADDKMMKYYLMTGKDLHTKTAIGMYGREDITKDERDKAKIVNFGVIFGMSPYTLQNELSCSLLDARNYRTAYYREYKGINEWTWETISKANETMESVNVYGAVRKLGSGDISKESLNTPIQGSCAYLMKIAMIRLHPLLKNYDAKIVAMIHDELLIEVPVDKADFVARLSQSVMEGANIARDFNVFISCPLTVGYEILDSWNMKEE